MAYVYRFLDTAQNIIYVGRTININNRIKSHFARGHLPRECYDSVKVVEYMEVNTEADSILVEQYFINKYHPKYNKQGKCKSEQTVRLDIQEKWKRYKVFNPKIKVKEKSVGEVRSTKDQVEVKSKPKWEILTLEVGTYSFLAYTFIKILFYFL